jgi:hypothetical protein
MTTLKRVLVLTSMLAGLAACGPDGGDATKAAATVDGGECQSFNPNEAAKALIGSWRYVSQTTSCSCDDGTTHTSSTNGSDIETFIAGCEPDQVIGIDAASPLGCQETCSVSGTTATCAPYECETSDGTDLRTTTDVYTLSNGQLQNVGGGTLTLPNGAACQCASNDGVLTKIQ